MLVFIIIYLLWRIIFQTPATTDELQVPTILDNHGKVLSKNIHKYMNTSIDPCDNFYEFACGNWRTYHPANVNMVQTRSMNLLHVDFDEKLNSLLKAEYGMFSDAERKLKDFYSSCMRTSSDVKDKLKQILKEFDDARALHKIYWNEMNFDWVKYVAEISYRYGVNIILGYSIKPDARNHSSNNLLLSNPEFISNTEQFRRTCEMLMVEYVGLSADESRRISWEIADFEAMLNEASHYNTKQPERGTMQSLHYKYWPNLNLRRLLDISLGYNLTPLDVVWVEHPNYLENLINIVRGTRKRVIANYISIRLLYHFWLEISQYPPGLQQSCTKVIKQKFPKVVSSMFYRSNLLETKKQYVQDLGQQILLTLHSLIESNRLKWLSDNARKHALEKLQLMKIQVATYEENRFDEEYSSLEISPHDYIQNIRKFYAFNAKKTRESLHEVPNHSDIALDLQTPVYVISSNEIIVPVSVLHSDFLLSTFNLNVVNFAHLGFCLSHEIMHGFSGEGRFYDKLGNYRKWWDKRSEHAYDKHRKCFRDQYHNFMYNDIQLPLSDNQDENVADNSGIVLTYEAFRSWSRNSEHTDKELDLRTFPGLNYTREQLFFIAYSQLWCADTLESERVRYAIEDVHAPSELRAFVPLTNFDKFSEVFQCPRGSPMNPVKKCKFFN